MSMVPIFGSDCVTGSIINCHSNSVFVYIPFKMPSSLKLGADQKVRNAVGTGEGGGGRCT